MHANLFNTRILSFTLARVSDTLKIQITDIKLNQITFN